MSEKKKVGILPLVPYNEAIERAKQKVELERDGVQRGLFCRWNELNHGMLKYWRFGHVTCIAAPSGAGKSYFLNMLHQDFVNPRLNANFGEEFMVIHACYEMDAADEVLRTVSASSGYSYAHLLSAEWEGQAYNRVGDQEMVNIESHFNRMKDKRIMYIETAGNLPQLYATIEAVHNKYPKRKLIISIDHVLLSARSDERDDLDLMANTAKLAILLKKRFGAMIILLAQLNGNIETDMRIQAPALHDPKKTDIHGSKQIYWACDNVIILHRPDLLGIPIYSARGMHSDRLVHVKLLKSRMGRPGDIFLYENLAKGSFENIPRDLLLQTNEKSLSELMEKVA